MERQLEDEAKRLTRPERSIMSSLRLHCIGGVGEPLPAVVLRAGLRPNRDFSA
jgi:hypothetical protein